LATERVERKLAAILAADIAGYSRLMGADEEGTLARLKAHRRELIDPKIAEHRGRIVKTTGDGLLVEFASPVEAVRCAGEIQKAMREREGSLPEERRIEIRIGINLGDVILDEDDVYGDGVNIAARLEALADPGGVVISSAVFEQVRDRVPDSFEDLGDQQVKNIARPVRVYRLAQLQTPVLPTAMSPLPLPDKPSIAVLPFANMSGDREQEYFADGMVEEIITALSRIRWLFVIARNSSFTYKGQSPDIKQVGRELGVRYVLQGSVRKAGQRVRITGQLIDAITGAHLWADRFDGLLEDVFELQDRVAISVAGIIEPALQAAEMRRSAARSTIDLTAYDLYLRALAAFFPITKERVFEALGLLDQAIAIDRHYGPALSLAAICHMAAVRDGWTEEAGRSQCKAIEFARQALEISENDPRILSNAALVLAHFGEDMGAMIGLIDRALGLNPSYARGWNLSGGLRLWAGQPDVAIEHLETARRLSPREPVGAPLSMIGGAYFFKRRFEEAAAKLLLSVQDHPGYPPAYRYLAACYAHMGQLAEARVIVARLRAITSQVVPSNVPYRNPADRELFLSGLRLAMGEAA
jgi:TolB-like protein/class 3 adenylate cyclase/Flp pilus assembly protein TadD